MADGSDVLNYLLGTLNMFRPRFTFSASHPECREIVFKSTGTRTMMIRLDVQNFGWHQADPPPCEVSVTQVRFNGGIIERDESRLSWKDVSDNLYRQKFTRNRLINVCSVDENTNPRISIWSEKGEKGYSINRGAGVYQFDLQTTCKGSPKGKATLTVGFDGVNWDNIYFVSLKVPPKWKAYRGDFIRIAVLVLLLIGYFATPYLNAWKLERDLSATDQYANEWPLTDMSTGKIDGMVAVNDKTLKAGFSKTKDDYRLTPMALTRNGLVLTDPRIIVILPLDVEVKKSQMWMRNVNNKYQSFYAEGFGDVYPNGARGQGESLFLKFPRPGKYQVAYIITGLANGVALEKIANFEIEMLETN